MQFWLASVYLVSQWNPVSTDNKGTRKCPYYPGVRITCKWAVETKVSDTCLLIEMTTTLMSCSCFLLLLLNLFLTLFPPAKV